MEKEYQTFVITHFTVFHSFASYCVNYVYERTGELEVSRHL